MPGWKTVDYDPSQGVSRDFDLFSLSAGLSQPLAEGWSLALQADIAERAPELEALYSNGAHLATQTFELGDDSLGEERATNLTLTVDGAMGEVELRASAYLTEFSDFLYLQDQGVEEDELPVRQWTQQDARFYGVEGEALFHLLESEGLSLDLRLTGDWVRARLDSGPPTATASFPASPRRAGRHPGIRHPALGRGTERSTQFRSGRRPDLRPAHRWLLDGKRLRGASL